LVNLSPADYAVIAAFFLCVLALGFSAKLKDDTSIEMVAAGRRLSPWLFLVTLVTTWYGGVLATGEFYAGRVEGGRLVDSYGLATLTVNGLPYWIAGLLFAFYLARRVRSEEQISLPERMERVYGRKCALLAALLVMALATPASYQYMLGTLLGQMTGLQLLPALLIGGVAGTLFLYKGGLLADARSNIISFVMMYAAFIVILVISVGKYGSPAQVIPNLPAADRTWDAGNGIVLVLSWMIVGSWTFVDPGFHQRVASVSTARAAAWGVLLAVGLWVVFDSLTTLTAMYGTMHFRDVAGSLPVSVGGTNLFPAFGDSLLPPVLKGMFFAGMLGAILAATVGYTFVSGTTLGRDFIGRLKRNVTEHDLNKYTRIGIAVASVGGILLAWQVKSVVSLWYSISSIMIPGLLIPVLGAYVMKRPPRAAVAFACMLAGSLAAGAWTKWPENPLSANVPGLTPIIVGLAASIIVWGIGSAILNGRRTDYTA